MMNFSFKRDRLKYHGRSFSVYKRVLRMCSVLDAFFLSTMTVAFSEQHSLGPRMTHLLHLQSVRKQNNMY